MSPAVETSHSQTEMIPFRLHPRVFTSLGSDLVTNDVVAILELVKNSYDAFAHRVDVRIIEHDDGNQSNKTQIIEIQDDGSGMTRKIIEDVWCVVATPYRLNNPYSEEGGNTRRVSGEKGLGRLSAARLGSNLVMYTKQVKNKCWQVDVSWEELSKGDTGESGIASIQPCESAVFPQGHGTLIRIVGLHTYWDEEKIDDLRDQLGRLISPFAGIEDFEIFLSSPYDNRGDEPTEIRPNVFLEVPPYLLKGHITDQGHLVANYSYNSSRGERTHNVDQMIWESSAPEGQLALPGDEYSTRPACGPFEFEIRIWDLDPDSILELSERYKLDRRKIRSYIKNYHGLSLYRDGILVLPKSDAARDWLGLDLRRVSKVGTRLSTSQMVGYVSLGADTNKRIKETSDRERLEENKAFKDFKKLFVRTLSILEDERDNDRRDAPHKEPPLSDLFSQLSPAPLLERVNSVAARGGQAAEVATLVDEYSGQVKEVIDTMERRLYYYSRLASLGVLAAMLVHEVRNQTLTIDGFLRLMKKLIVKIEATYQKKAEEELALADRGVQSLERLAERFSPLARRTAKGKHRTSIVEEIILDCVAMREQDIKKKGIKVEVPDSRTESEIDPGEFTAVIINLLDNAIYWISFSDHTPRTIRFDVDVNQKTKRVFVRVNDTGPGINSGDEERIFWPGVTRKEEGFGMGLTVASEIVSQYGGRMGLIKPGLMRGASFELDLPLK